MNSKYRILHIAILFISSISIGTTQNDFLIGMLPTVDLNYKLDEHWALHYKFQSRQQFVQDDFQGGRRDGYDYILTDQTVYLVRKVGLNARVSGAYLFRLTMDGIVHRAIQQYALTLRQINFKLSHRVVTDQTFTHGKLSEFRLRYRMASEIPLNGLTADVKEFYVKLSTELLNKFERENYALELRLVSGLGYRLNPSHRFEVGLDYRLDDLLSSTFSHRFWTVFNWYVNF